MVMQKLAAKAVIAQKEAVDAAVKEIKDTKLFGDNWNVVHVINNTGDLVKKIGSALLIVIGAVMIIVGIFKIAQGLISHGKTQVNWVVNILLIVVGALFCAGAGFFLKLTAEDGVGKDIANTIIDLGN